MLVFYKARLVMLAIPKTGTTAYETALAPYADWVVSGPPDLKHAPLYRYDRFFRPIFEKVCGARMETLAVMRDPIDWLGSWYRYRRREDLRGQDQGTTGVSFDEFVKGYLKGKPPAFANVGRQGKFLTPRPGGEAVTHLFRYDDPASLHAFLHERLGISVHPERKNVSPQMALELSPGVERRLRQKLHEDFALFDRIG
ncbi:MAG: gamma-glutamyl kinase [Marinibacterium sp.]